MKENYPIMPISKLIVSTTNWNPLDSKTNEFFTYIDISSVNRETKQVEEAVKILTHEAPSRARQLLKTGDVLVSTVRPNLNAVAHIDAKFDGATASTGFCVLRTEPGKLDSRYLYYWVRTSYFIEDMVKRSTGASYPAVSDSIIKESQIPIPPLEEQHRIAAILDKASAIRSKRFEAIRLTEELLRAVFLDMFGNPVTNPKGWEVKPLGEVCSRVTVGFVGSMASEYIEEGIPWLRSLNIKRNQIIFDELKYVSKNFHKRLPKSSLAPGDVVTVRTGNAGVTAVIPVSLPEANCSDLIVMTCNSQLMPCYLSETLNLLLGDRDGGTGLTGAIQKHFNIQKAKELLIPVPSISLQEKWAKVLYKFASVKYTQEKTEEESNNLFNSLLHRAFRGEL